MKWFDKQYIFKCDICIFLGNRVSKFETSGSLVFTQIWHWEGGKLVYMHVLICGSPCLSSVVFACVALSFLPSLCLPQKVTRQQQEINNLAQKRTTVDEDVALMKKELTSLHEQLVNKDQELKVDRVNFPWQHGSQSLQVSFLCFTNHYYSPVILFVCFNCNRKKCCLARLCDFFLSCLFFPDYLAAGMCLWERGRWRERKADFF